MEAWYKEQNEVKLLLEEHLGSCQSLGHPLRKQSLTRGFVGR